MVLGVQAGCPCLSSSSEPDDTQQEFGCRARHAGISRRGVIRSGLSNLLLGRITKIITGALFLCQVES